MKRIITIMFAMSVAVVGRGFGQASFRVPITLTNGTNQTVLRLGVNTGNTIGTDTSQALGQFREVPAPPPPPPPYDWDTRFVTIPGRTVTFPIGLGGGVWSDNRGYNSSTQVDSFKIVISGDATDNAATVVSWPSDLASYGTSWTIKPQAGSDWPVIDMLTSPSVTIGAGLHKNIIIIKVGAMGTNDVPTAAGGFPTTYRLAQNYPNPFNPSTAISFSIPSAGITSLVVYNVIGQEVATLLNEFRNAGSYTLSFNASNLPSGAYLYRLRSAGYSATKRMLLLK